MAQKISRRTLAKAVALQLAEGATTPHLAKALAAYLIQHRMTTQLDMLLGDIAYELMQRDAHLYATVQSTHRLSESLRKQVTQYLKAQAGVDEVELVEEIDPTLVGGLVIQTPDELMDASIRAKLRQMASVGD